MKIAFPLLRRLFSSPPFIPSRSATLGNFSRFGWKWCWRNFSNDCNFNYIMYTVPAICLLIRDWTFNWFLFSVEKIVCTMSFQRKAVEISIDVRRHHRHRLHHNMRFHCWLIFLTYFFHCTELKTNDVVLPFAELQSFALPFESMIL